MMRLSLLLLLVVTALAFTIPQQQHQMTSTSTTQPNMTMISRQDAVVGVMAGLVTFPQASNAFSQQLDDYQWEPQQQPTDGRLDLNSAFVVSFYAKAHHRVPCTGLPN